MARQSTPKSAPPKKGSTQQDPFPKVDFTTFIFSISSAAFMGLGMIPSGGEKHSGSEGKVNLDLVRQNIDLLELMQEKTKGNLSSDEAKLLEHLLFEIRMRFLEVQNKVEHS